MKNYLYCISLLIFLFGCSTNEPVKESPQPAEEPEAQTASQSRTKAVIGLYPIELDENQPAALTLGEAYSTELQSILDSMQTYDIRFVPEKYTAEDLFGREYDNLILSEVAVESDGGLRLSSRVLDAHSGEEKLELKETTYDYLKLFPIAEQMVGRMVEGLYGSRPVFSTLRVFPANNELKIYDKNHDYYVFVDGIYREHDEDNQLRLLAGAHDIMLMGFREDWLYDRKTLEFPEEDTAYMYVYPSKAKQLLYTARNVYVEIDGDPRDWGRVKEILVDGGAGEMVDPSMDMQSLKLVFDRDRLYGLIEFAEEFTDEPAQIALHFLTEENSESGLILTRKSNKDPKIEVLRQGDKVSERGSAVIAGRYAEFSISRQDLALAPETPYSLQTFVHYGRSWKDDHEDSLSRMEKIMLTENSTGILAWLNRQWEPGSDGPSAQYYVPYYLIDTDGDPSEWTTVPVTASNTGSQEDPGSLYLLKTARDEEFLYLFLQSRQEWDSGRKLSLELDTGEEHSLVIVMEGDSLYLEKDGAVSEIGGQLSSGTNFLEARISLNDLAEDRDFFNLMQVSQQGGNRITVLPYY